MKCYQLEEAQHRTWPREDGARPPDHLLIVGGRGEEVRARVAAFHCATRRSGALVPTRPGEMPLHQGQSELARALDLAAFGTVVVHDLHRLHLGLQGALARLIERGWYRGEDGRWREGNVQLVATLPALLPTSGWQRTLREDLLRLLSREVVWLP